MAEIYRRIDGEKIERLIARSSDAYYGTQNMAGEYYSRAKMVLARHRAYGGSEVHFEKSDFLTWLVSLTDSPTAHDKAFKHGDKKDFYGVDTIEYGHETKGGEWVDGPAPLRRALDAMGWGADYGLRVTGRGKRQ